MRYWTTRSFQSTSTISSLHFDALDSAREMGSNCQQAFWRFQSIGNVRPDIGNPSMNEAGWKSLNSVSKNAAPRSTLLPDNHISFRTWHLTFTRYMPRCRTPLLTWICLLRPSSPPRACTATYMTPSIQATQVGERLERLSLLPELMAALDMYVWCLYICLVSHTNLVANRS